MGLADQLQQGLAGIGAYILCLLGLLLGPSGLLGGVFGPLLALINLALLFVGGIQLIMVNPACTLLESCHERQGPNVISSFVWFCVFAALASTALGPAQVAIQLNTVDDVLDASVCDWRAWGDTGGGVYFNDGTTKIPGKESSFHLPVNLTVEHCEWLSVRWYPCQLYVEPVLRCGEPTSSCKDVCAWAISPESDRINFKGCRQGDGNLCGIALSLMRLTQGKCAGPDARDGFCQRANQELGGLLDDLAKNLSVTTSWGGLDFSNDRGEMAPLVWMVDPQEVRTYWDQWVWIFVLLSIIYLPAPLLAAYCVVSWSSDEWPIAELLKGLCSGCSGCSLQISTCWLRFPWHWRREAGACDELATRYIAIE